MSSQTPVINVSGDFEETILRLAKHLGRDKHRRAVFNLIYGRGSRPRSKKQIADALGIAGKAQVIQNALDELSRHHLIDRIENKGHVKDTSRWVYGKENSIRANKDAILRFADNPAAAKQVATKRRPAIVGNLSFVRPTQRRRVASQPSVSSRSKRPARLRIALLVTNPVRRASLQTMVEARDIEAAIKLGGNPDETDLKVVLAPTLDSVLDALNSYKPDVIHFSGHGGGRALLLDNEKAGDDGGTVLDFDMIARVIDATNSRPKLLVLAACDTADGADRFLDVVPAVVAMTDTIDDEAACEFSARFYRSLSAGATIEDALQQARILLDHKGYPDALLPSLIVASDSAARWAFL